MNLEAKLQQLIKKQSFPFLEESVLNEVLKRKLTKKEYKILCAETDDKEILLEKLNITQERYQQISTSLKKKLNSEKIKQLIYFI